MPEGQGITVAAVLRLDAVRRGDPLVVAGHDRLERPIRWVHAGEVPAIATLLQGGELLLTTGIGIGPGAAEQRAYAAELAERDVAGVVIELGTTFSEIPLPLAREAERRGLPLVALRSEVRFVEITEAAHREIIHRQFMLMRRGAELHRRFFSLVLDGAGIPEVLAALADTIANPVALLGPDERVIYQAHHHGADPSAGGHAPRIEQPVPMGSLPPARLVATGATSPLDDFDRVALERAASVIALVLLRNREADVELERGSLLGQLLDRPLDEGQAAALARDLGLGERPGLRLPVAATLAASDRGPATSWAPVLPLVRRLGEHAGSTALSTTRDRGRVLLLAVTIPREAARVECAGEVAAQLRTAAVRHLGASEPPVVCIGRAATSWTALHQAFDEVLGELPEAGHAAATPWHDATMPSLAGLLWSLRDDAELQRFVDARLGPLTVHDRDRDGDLLDTLAALCAHGGRKAETARTLGLERQTLYRRLRRIEQLLDADLADEDTLLGVHLALHARRA